MTLPRRKQPLTIDQLNANHYMVTAHKYGFFLCLRGTARILLGSQTYQISRNHLCLYAPDTFFQILDKSCDLDGILEEDSVDAYYPVLSLVDIRKRLMVRSAPCVKIAETQAAELTRLYGILLESTSTSLDGVDGVVATIREHGATYLRYAICLKVMEAYFSNTPVEAMPLAKGDVILNRFLVSVHENCSRQRTVSYYAGEQHLSPYYFSSIIKAASGRSALQWIHDVTMTFSRQYLAGSQMSIKEISDRLNFPDQSTFCRYFKHHDGCSPSDYRENISQELKQ